MHADKLRLPYTNNSDGVLAAPLVEMCHHAEFEADSTGAPKFGVPRTHLDLGFGIGTARLPGDLSIGKSCSGKETAKGRQSKRRYLGSKSYHLMKTYIIL